MMFALAALPTLMLPSSAKATTLAVVFSPYAFGEDLDLAVLHDRDARVAGAQVDSDGPFSHALSLRSNCGPAGIAATGLSR